MPKDKFPVMLVSPMKEMKRITFPCIAQTKMDGMRAIIVVEGEVVTVYINCKLKKIAIERIDQNTDRSLCAMCFFSFKLSI